MKQEGEDSESSDDYVIINPVPLPEGYHVSNALFNKPKYSDSDISELQDVTNILDCYLWLTNHFPESFIEVDAAIVIKDRCCEIIDAILVSDGRVAPFEHLESDKVDNENQH